MYGLGEKLRTSLSGRIMSAQDSVGERGDIRPAAGVMGAVSTMVMVICPVVGLYWRAAGHGLDLNPEMLLSPVAFRTKTVFCESKSRGDACNGQYLFFSARRTRQRSGTVSK